MVKRYIAALLLIPLADAILLVVVADLIGWPVTVLLVVLTGLLGLLFVRVEGRNTLRRLQVKVETGELPTDELLDGALLIAAGAFFLTPGLVTDALAVLLVVPITRYPIRGLIKRIVKPLLERRTEGFVTGNVYTGGFPDPEDVEADSDDPYVNLGFGRVGGDFGTERSDGDARQDGGDVYDLDEDAYSVDIEDDDGDEK